MAPLIPSFSSIPSVSSQASTSQCNIKADWMRLSGVLAVTTFEITFLGTGVGVDHNYFQNLIITAKLSVIERLSIECHKTKTKPLTYQLDYSANLKP